MNLTKNIVLFRQNLVNLPASLDKVDNTVLAMSVASEIMQFGFILSEDAIFNIKRASEDDIITFHNEIIEFLKEMTGSKRTYSPFWKGFPQEVMDKSEVELWLHQIVHYLSNGHYEPNEWTEARPTAFERTQYTTVTSCDDDVFLNIFTKLVSINTSLTPDDLSVVKFFVENKYELRLPDVIPFKENLCTLAGMGIDVPIQSVTDVLRIAVQMSGGDISLPKVPYKTVRRSSWSSQRIINPIRESFKFKKFSRSERRLLLGLLEKTNCDVREAVLKDGRWIRLGEILHPGEYAKAFPRAFKMFNTLRNEKVQSWYGQVDSEFKKSLDAGLAKLSERPGEFMRKLDWLVRTNQDNRENLAKVFDVFKRVAPKTSNKVIFESMAHFEDRLCPVTDRRIMVKGARNSTILPDLPGIRKGALDTIDKTLFDAIGEKFSSMPPLGKVYIDYELEKITLPKNMRSVSSSLRPIIRGQRIPFRNKHSKVIRAFCHWFDKSGNEDIDLSATLVDVNGIKSTVVGWNGDHNQSYACYSGDVRHRRGACAEYIDIDIAGMINAGYRYAVLDARNYSGRGLNTLECYFGYESREFPQGNDIHYAPSTDNCMRLQSTGENSILVILDVQEMEYIMVDEDQSGLPVASANNGAIIKLVNYYSELPKFSVYDLIALHTQYRGTEVQNKEEADIVIDVNSFPTYVEIAQWMGI